MSSIPGPRKLVLIHSGVYPYAEIELDESIHLSGRNNAGKSSLLNALQFLYIDDIKLMHFPETNFQGKTKPFYFKPDGRSTILVEADTKWGIRTVGFHGLGSAAGCDWQRFGFEGAYEKDDFIDPETEQPRAWEDVKNNLAFKGYVELTQGQLRNALRGSGERNSFRLELVPAGGNYDTFIEVFRQLLSLRKSKPDDLKRLLISVVEPELSSGDERNRGIVALSSIVGDAHARAHSAQLRYERIRNAEKLCLNLFGDFDRLQDLQARLPQDLQEIYRETQARMQDRRRRADDAAQAASDASEAEAQWNLKRKDLDRDIRQMEGQKGSMRTLLDQAYEARRQLDNQPKAMLEAKLVELHSTVALLREDLRSLQGAGDGTAMLKEKSARYRRDAQANLEHAARLHAMDDTGNRPSWMEVLEDFPREEREPLLRLINPALLTLPEGAEGMELVNPQALGNIIASVARASKDQIFSGAGLRVNLDHLPAPALGLDDPEARAREIEMYEGRAEHQNREADRLMALADDSRRREKLQESLKTSEAEEFSISQLLSKMSIWEEEIAKIPEREEKLKDLENTAYKLEETREEALTRHEEARTQARIQQRMATELSQEAEALRNQTVRDLENMALPLGLELDPDLVGYILMDDQEFRETLGRIGEEWGEARRLDMSVEKRLEEIEIALDGMIAGDREAKVHAIRDLIEGLPDQKAQLDADWQHIAVTAKTSFSNLLRDYDTLVQRVGRLNKAMAKFSVSNLTRIQLKVVENESRTTVLKRFTQEEGLFADVGLADKAKEQVSEWIRAGEVFRLFDLFGIQLEVSKDSETKVYASLDAESTGTAITLKVVFLAHLLRDLYRARTDVRLLIFVDEVDTLDDVNQETIRACAKELGFTLIMASPNPANAKRLYFLRPEGRVTYIHPEEALEVTFLEEPEYSETAE